MAKSKTVKISDEQYLRAYREMLTARRVDDKAIVLYKQNKAHFQIGCAGHEAVQAAFAHATRPAYDWSYPYYRDMAFCVGWGMSPQELFLSILNKADDPNSGGRQMPMHYGHSKLNIVSQSSPTGTQYLQSVGAAKAIAQRGVDEVVYVSSGEGTTAQGDYYEAINWAARELLPVIFVIQDNKFAISVHISEQLPGASVAKAAKGFGDLPVLQFDGTDYAASYAAATEAVARARSGKGPTLVVAEVVRLQSHSISDNQEKYRSKKDIEHDKESDPLRKLSQFLIQNKIATKKELSELEAAVAQEVDEAARWAEAQPDPAPETATNFVYIGNYPDQHTKEADLSTVPQEKWVHMVDALNHALDEELTRIPEMFIYGQDVAYGKGGVFSVTQGLTQKHGEDRVFNSPLAESSIVGTAIGMATLGLRPVVEIQFGDYIWTGMMHLRNELPLMLYRSNGAFSCPAVVRVAVGGYISGALYHSQNIESYFAHIPGLLVIMPSNATDAKGLLKSAIRCPDPVLFLEHKGLYRQPFSKGPEGGPEDLIPIGKAKIVRKGTDATIITWGALVRKSLVAAEAVAKEGYNVEVIDLRTISPLDSETILESVSKTGKALIAHEDNLFMGFGAEVAAQISEHAFDALDAPIKRIGAKFAPIPHAASLENEILPQNDDVLNALRELLEY